MTRIFHSLNIAKRLYRLLSELLICHVTWSGVGVCGLGLEAGVGWREAGRAKDASAGVVRPQRPAEVSSGQRPRARVVEAEPAAVLAA